MVVKVTVEGQSLSWCDHPPRLADGSVKFVQFKFTTSLDWEGYERTAQFSQNGEAYNMLLDDDGYCDMPAELVAGDCTVSLFGYRANQPNRATGIPLPFVIQSSGFESSAETPLPPTPDLYAQLLGQIPEALPNPHPLVINGQAYDGSNQVTLNLSTGNGGGTGTFIINVTGDETAGYSVDKTGDEIRDAYKAGMLLSCKHGNAIIPLVYGKPSAVVKGPDAWLFAAITEAATSTKVAINVRRVPTSKITTTVTETNYVVASGTDTDVPKYLMVPLQGDPSSGYTLGDSMTLARIWDAVLEGANVMCILEITGGVVAVSWSGMVGSKIAFSATAKLGDQAGTVFVTIADDNSVSVELIPVTAGGSGSASTYAVVIEGDDASGYRIAGAFKSGAAEPMACTKSDIDEWLFNGDTVLCTYDSVALPLLIADPYTMGLVFGATIAAEGFVQSHVIQLSSDGTVVVQMSEYELGGGSAPMVAMIADAGDGTFVLSDVEANPIEDPYDFFISNPWGLFGAVILENATGRLYRASVFEIAAEDIVFTCNDGTAQHRYIIHADNTITYDVITLGSDADTEMVLSDNLFDKSTAVEGKVFYYSSSGLQLVDSSWSCYAYVPLRGPGTYRTKWNNNQHASTTNRVGIVKEDNSWLQTINGTLTATDNAQAYDMEFTVTQTMINNGAAKIAFDCAPDLLDTVMIVKDREYPDEYIPYGYIEVTTDSGKKHDNILAGKTAVFLGDSICAGTTVEGEYYNYGWAGLIGEPNRMNWTNYGMNGGTVTSLSGVQNTRWLTTQADKALSEHPAADYVIFEGGCNDADQMKDDLLGTISSDYATFDITTFSGAFEALVLKLVTSFPTAKIGYIIPQKMYAQNNHTATGHVHRRFFDRAIEICEKWGIPYVDLWKGNPLNPKLSTASMFYTDGQHLTLAGYQRITPQIEAFMRNL